MIESNRMTAGSPAKHILKLAFPLMFGNIFQQLYTIVDTAVVGKALGVNALAALGTTEWMIFLMVGAIQGITHGFSVVVAQRFGNKEEEGVSASVIAVAIKPGATALQVTLREASSRATVLVRPISPALLAE